MQSLCVEFLTLFWRMEKKKLVKIIPKELLERLLLVNLVSKNFGVYSPEKSI